MPLAPLLLGLTLAATGGSPEALLERVRTYLAAEQLEPAVALHDSLAAAWAPREEFLLPYLELAADLINADRPGPIPGALDAWIAAVPELQAATHPWSGRVWITRGRAAYYAGRAEEAIDNLERGCTAAAGTDDPDFPVVDCADELGYLHWEQGGLEPAARWWRAAIQSRESATDVDPDELIWRRTDLAEVERLLGHYAAAESLLTANRSEPQARQLRTRNVAIALNNLGALYRDQNRLDEAERLYREARTLSEELLARTGAGDEEAQRRLINARLNLGNLLLSQDRLAEAHRELTATLESAIAHLPPDDATTFYARDTLARILSAQGDATAAEAAWNDALAGIAGDTTSRTDLLRADLLHERGMAQLDRGLADDAVTSLTRAVDLWRTHLGPDHPSVGRGLGSLARAGAARGDDPTATIELADRGLRILSRQQFWPEERALTLATRGELQVAAGRTELGLADLEEALAAVESLRAQRGGTAGSRHRFLRRFASKLESLVRWRIERGEALAALEVAETMRARLLQDELLVDRDQIRAGIDADIARGLVLRERAARATLAGLRRDTQEGRDVDGTAWDAAVTDLEAVQQEWRLHSPAWARALRPQTVASVRDLRAQLLQAGHGWLYYLQGLRDTYVFLIPAPPTPVVALTLGEDPAALPDAADQLELALLDDALRGVIGVRPADGAAPAPPSDRLDPGVARRMHDLFDALVPAAMRPALRQLEELVVIPDGTLHAVPFDALVVEPPLGSEPVYWLDTYPVVSYAHGIRALGELATTRPRRDVAVVSVSRPTFAAEVVLGGVRTSLPDLPGTALESAAVAEAFGAQRVRILSGPAATEAAFRTAAPGARYLHLATHGLVDTERDHRLAALALTPGPTDSVALDDDGFLQLFELMQLDLACDLAVLSACDTRGGPTESGEGVYALSRGFHIAGARQVLATLWPVADRSTAQLIGAVFAGLAAAERAGTPPHVARLLRDAKRTLRHSDRWSHPAFWAPFVLSGAAGTPTSDEGD